MMRGTGTSWVPFYRFATDTGALTWKLPPPTFRRMRCSLTCALTLALLVAGCERAGDKPTANAAAPSVPVRDSSMGAVAGSGWHDADGPFILVAGESPHTGAMVFPGQGDTTTLAIPGALAFHDHPTLTLLGRAGTVGRARLTGALFASDTSCDAWPIARLAPLDPASDRARWSVAFVEHTAHGLALDSVEHLSRADSARLVAELARLASGLPNDTVATLRGLPFNVRGAWRFPVDASVIGVVAEITRRVAQEANQREERLLVVAERDTASTSRWTASYSLRATGTEETVDAFDVLAVARLGRDARLVVVMSRESVHGIWYEIIARDADGHWRRQWRSPPAGC